MKRILILADINSAHIQKWVNSLVLKGFHIGIFSLGKAETNWYINLPNFELFNENVFNQNIFYQSTFKKISFLKVLPSLKNAIKLFKPDIVHAHYASSYGFLGTLCKFHPFIISVWGSDVFDFPKRNYINKKVLMHNLKIADYILSTSEAMKRETELYTDKKILLTPFGVDLNSFKPFSAKKEISNKIFIGTIKKLEETYGISYFINAFNLLIEKYKQLDLHLLLVGDGAETDNYKQQVVDLKLEDKVTFTGRIPHNEVMEYYNRLDIFVAVSLRESFGVAVLEASACEKPVVVSNVGGLPEVVRDGSTGFIVPPRNITATAAAIEKLILDKNLRISLGKNGRKFVAENYNWNLSIEKMIEVYNNI